QKERELCCLAARNGQIVHLSLRDDRRTNLIACRIDQRLLGGNTDRLFDAAGVENDVALKLLADGENDVSHLRLSETVTLPKKLIFSGRQRGDPIAPISPGEYGARASRIGVARCDVDVRQSGEIGR